MKHKGFTLIELIVAIAVFSIFGLAVFNFSQTQFNIYKNEKVQNDLQSDAKLAVSYISNDIKNAKTNPYSVETDFTEQKFSAIASDLKNKGYKPLVYIDDIDGNSYLYAIENNELHKIAVTSACEFTLKTNSDGALASNIITGYDPEDVSAYNGKQFSNNVQNSILPYLGQSLSWQAGVQFMYESYGQYFVVYYESGSYYQCEMLPDTSNVTYKDTSLSGEEGTLITSNVDSITVVNADSSNNAYNILVNLSENIIINGVNNTITSSYSTCASRLGYDGGGY